MRGQLDVGGRNGFANRALAAHALLTIRPKESPFLSQHFALTRTATHTDANALRLQSLQRRRSPIGADRRPHAANLPLKALRALPLSHV